MIQPEDLSQIGFIKRTHGVKGELQIELENEVALDQGDFLFVNIHGQFIPYPINSIKSGSGYLILSFEFVKDMEMASTLIGRELYITKGDQQSTEVHSLIGYALIDDKLERIGSLKQMLQFPQQEMMVVEYNGKERMIPFVEAIVKAVSHENKEIYCNLPIGLLDL